jgi:hypothetical protein
VRRAALALLVALLGASCRSKGDATPPAASASAAGEATTPAPNDPDEIDPSGAPEGSSTPAGSASARARRERAALPLPPTAMPDPPPPPNLRPDAGSYAAIVSIFDDYGFPPYPRVEALCGRRVYKQGGTHLTWDAFTSSDEPQALVAHYKRRLGEPGFSAEGDGGTWRLPAGARTPQRTLSISRTGQSGPHEGCEKKPGTDAKSVLLLSRDH